MTTLKKTLAIFLMVCMLAGMMPVGTAFATNDIPADGAMPISGPDMGAPEAGDIPAGDAAHVHSWNKETGKCDGCGAECGHETKESFPAVSSTCTQEGLTAGEKCVTCGMITVVQTATPVIAHTFDADGTCTVCSASSATNTTDTNPGGTDTTDPTPPPCAHEGGKTILAAKTATCTEAGLTEGEVCNLCGETIKAQETIAVTGHSYGEDGLCEFCHNPKPEMQGAAGGEMPTADGAHTHDWNYSNVNEAVCKGPDCTEKCIHKDATGNSLFKDSVCQTCNYTCNHTDKEDGTGNSTWDTTTDPSKVVCTVCGTVCLHKNGTKSAFVKTEGDSTKRTCSICKFTCSHAKYNDSGDGKCATCNYSCPHKDADGKSTFEFDATNNNYPCTICKKPCGHSSWNTENVDSAWCKGCGKKCDHKLNGNYNFDPATGKCANGCAYTCLHGDVTNNQCNICKMAMAAKVVKSDSSEAYYATANMAVSKADAGDTVKLLHNITIDTTKDVISVRNRTVVLDLNGYTLTAGTGDAPRAISISLNGDLTIKNGTINCVNNTNGIDIIGPGSPLTIEDGVHLITDKNSSGIYVGNKATGASVTVNGSIEGSSTGVYVAASGTTVTVNGSITATEAEKPNAEGEMEKYGIGIYVEAPNVKVNVNGSVSGGNSGVLVGKGGVDVGGTVVNVSGMLHGGECALVSNGASTGATAFNVNNGAVLTADKLAIYQPNVQGSLTVEDGTTITGGLTGIEIRGGTANIKGGTITGKATTFDCKPATSGSTTTGAGLAVALYGTENNKIDVTILGGTITGIRAIHEEDAGSADVFEKGTVNITVTGGTLKGGVYSKDDRITFTGDAKQPDITPNVSAGTATLDSGFINAGATNVIDAIGTDAKELVLEKISIAESATPDTETKIEFKTDAAEVTLDKGAIDAIYAAIKDDATVNKVTLHVEKVAGAAEDTYQIYIEDQNSNKIGSGTGGLGNSNVQVVLKSVDKKPAQVRHYDANKTFLELPGFTYDAASKSVTVTINHFSFLTLSQTAIPVITTTAPQLPNAQAGRGYYTKIEASGEPAPTFAVDPATPLPKGLSLDAKTGEITGTVDPGAKTGDYAVKITASNSAGSAEKTYTITVEKYVAAKLYDTDGTTELGTYGTVQKAIDAAQNEQTVVLVENSTDNVLIEGKNIYITGEGIGRYSLGNIEVKEKDGAGVVGIENITSPKLTVYAGAGAALGDRCYIKTVENYNPYDKTDNLPYVHIVSGNYEKLLPAKGGSYQVTGGTFVTELPMEYCREVDENGKFVRQYYARKNSVSSLYDIAPFKFEITKVSNSGYHMPGSQKTLVFSTNLDYTLADRDRASSSITITTGNSSKAISSVYYDISEGKNGKAEITLKASTLNALSVGRYRLQYNGPTGTDYMYFHISNTVKTGDSSNIGLWLGIMGGSVVVLCAVAAVLVIKSKKKNGGAKTKEKK